MSKRDSDLETFIAWGDNHGDIVNPYFEEKLVKHIKLGLNGRPFDHRIHLGDVIDARPARKGASPKERSESMLHDRDSAVNHILRTRPTVMLLGNHDDRLWELAAAKGFGGAEADQAHEAVNAIKRALREVGCKVVKPYHIKTGKWKLGPITFIHGYASGQAAVRESARAYNCKMLVMGHLHRIERINVNKEEGCVGISVGCIGDIDQMEYAKKTQAILTWGNGWLIGYWDKKTNEVRAMEIIRAGGKIRVPQNFVTL